MTNPNNAIGTNAAYNGRTSVNAFNDVLAALSRGVVSGWECKPGTRMTVTIGGNGTTRDVAIAEDNVGNKTTINNITGSPVSVTISAAPGANSRIDAIVAYVDGTAKGSADQADNPACCGLIAVAGTTASSPSAPGDSAIRSAITSDGANGTSAYYVVLATIKVTTSLTTITQNNITAGAVVKLTPKGAVTSQNVDYTTMCVEAAKSSVSSAGVSVEAIIQSLTIPETGRWKVEAIINGYSDQRSQTYELIQSLKKNGTAFMIHNRCFSSAADSYLWMGATIIGSVDANKGDKIDSTIVALNHSIQHIDPDHCYMVATRIG